jgi:hypothetical protein
VIESRAPQAVLISRSAGFWKTLEPVQVQVTECRRDALAVDIVARETVCYEVVHPEGVVGLQFLQNSEGPLPR